MSPPKDKILHIVINTRDNGCQTEVRYLFSQTQHPSKVLPHTGTEPETSCTTILKILTTTTTLSLRQI